MFDSSSFQLLVNFGVQLRIAAAQEPRTSPSRTSARLLTAEGPARSRDGPLHFETSSQRRGKNWPCQALSAPPKENKLRQREEGVEGGPPATGQTKTPPNHTPSEPTEIFTYNSNLTPTSFPPFNPPTHRQPPATQQTAHHDRRHSLSPHNL